MYISNCSSIEMDTDHTTITVCDTYISFVQEDRDVAVKHTMYESIIVPRYPNESYLIDKGTLGIIIIADVEQPAMAICHFSLQGEIKYSNENLHRIKALVP
ncbi:uncharacterized protein [Dysidea avara]|uniref:uncharacterized protein n=1 Tax=Dysidea avara TaxID=196820 RepID=UPI0033276E25